MGIAFILAIWIYAAIMLIGCILLGICIVHHRLLSLKWLFGACLTFALGFYLLSTYGFDERHLHREYSNIAIVWYGFIGWHTLILAAGVYGAFFWRKINFIVGMSSGFAFVALWWFARILYLTEWH